jgi:hypothetical protein
MTSYQFIPFISVRFHHPTSTVFDPIFYSPISDPISKIKCENECGRGVIPTDTVHFHPYS